MGKTITPEILCNNTKNGLFRAFSRVSTQMGQSLCAIQDHRVSWMHIVAPGFQGVLVFEMETFVSQTWTQQHLGID
jgi:hypothetical protein